jgi:hypothetical protein
MSSVGPPSVWSWLTSTDFNIAFGVIVCCDGCPATVWAFVFFSPPERKLIGSKPNTFFLSSYFIFCLTLHVRHASAFARHGDAQIGRRWTNFTNTFPSGGFISFGFFHDLDMRVLPLSCFMTTLSVNMGLACFFPSPFLAVVDKEEKKMELLSQARQNGVLMFLSLGYRGAGVQKEMRWISSDGCLMAKLLARGGRKEGGL